MSDKQASTGTDSGSLGVFSRRSSGLVRQLSIVDMTWYGILAAGALFGLVYVFPVPQLFMPGVSVPISALIAMVIMIPVFIVYAGFGSAMPRMGGDYLYQSRALHPAVGFTFTFAWEVFMWITFTTVGGIVVSQLGLQPLLYNLGLTWDSTWLIDKANWFGSPDGLLVTTLVLVVLAFITTVRGIGVYRKVQRWFIVPAILISNLTLLILLLRSKDSFLSHFDAFHEKAFGMEHASQKVTDFATSAAISDPGFSLKYTVLFLSVTGLIWYVVFGAQGLLGETKQANNFGKLFKAFTIGGLFVGLFAWVLPTFLFQNMVGGDFMYAYANAAGVKGGVPVAAGTSIPSLAMMMTTSPIVSLLLSIGFIAVGFYFANCVFMNMTRVLSAMGMDRTLPEWFSRVSQKFHAPVNAAIFYFIVAVGINFLFRYDEEAQSTIVLGGAFTSVGVIAVTSLSAIFFVKRAKHVYDVSPVAKHRLFGLPLIAVAGAVSFICAGGVTVANLFVPELGFTTGWARTLLLISLVVSAIWFFAYRAWQKSRGVDIDLTFKEIPPE
ncbi:MAG: APC family permease [Solirubrobacterales bacterium]|nr:APC family permease [Solirubrobacterales bacterium]